MILVLLIDAFRADYLQKTSYLRELGAVGTRGRFREPFGFAPHASYFGGLTPGEAGYSHLYWLDPEASPFHAARNYPDPRLLTATGGSAIREQIRRLAASETTQYAASYIHPQEIPVQLLPLFDVPEKFPPWDERCGYRSLFHDLAARGKQWLYAAWPVLNQLGLRNDREIVWWVLENARPEHALVHAQLCELDAAGHVYGPASRNVLDCILSTDGLVRELVSGLERIAPGLNVLIFGDHGMVPVVRPVDLAAALASLPLCAPEDYVYFLDSTIARFWYHNEYARTTVRTWLKTIPGGHLLSQGDLDAWGMRGIDPRNAEDYWLADPGILIVPNFFHDAAAAPRGMHGYAPEEPDNEGVFIAAGPALPRTRQTGSVSAQSLHALTRALLSGERLDERLLPPNPNETPAGAAAERIESDLSVISYRIARHAPDCAALVLCGAFGRGEGTVLIQNGAARALNDYDVAVVGGDPAALQWKEEGRRLAADLGMPYVDLGWFPADYFERATPTIFNYDFRYGSRVLSGDHGILDRMAHIAEDEIPPDELLRLLLNRASGLLIGLRGEFLPPAPVEGKDREFLWIQVMKLGIAVADHFLFQWGGYDTRYTERRRRFATLGASAGLSENLLAGIDRCFALKLYPDTALQDDPRTLLSSQTVPWREALATRLNGGSGWSSLAEAAADYIESRAPDANGQQERIRGCAALLWDALDESLCPSAERLDRASAIMSKGGIPVDAAFRGSAIDRYEQLRSAFVTAWEAHCH